jgi:hypothetical protein
MPPPILPISANMSSAAIKSPLIENDRRRSQRKPHVVQAWISSPTAVDPDDRQEVLSVNVSRHGVAFESHHAIATGTYHIIDIAMGPQRMRTEIRILSCRKMDSARFEIGAEYA